MVESTDSGMKFQHTAARRRLAYQKLIDDLQNVSTHSRPKAADRFNCQPYGFENVSTHSRPKAADRFNCQPYGFENVSTHSRPKAAVVANRLNNGAEFSFNTQPPEGG